MGDDHPVVWCKEFGAGRSFHTALGHAIDAYTAPAFRRHLLGGRRWAAGGSGPAAQLSASRRSCWRGAGWGCGRC
ncbi:ThuA domain-containing protein [Streptomyces sp. NPDC058695]|uniref:ThuA domain-containing protein n=1 Tax=Streptomyces sp. NPDC058695 TaxID=3346604 RepID=UPI0036609A5F